MEAPRPQPAYKPLFPAPELPPELPRFSDPSSPLSLRGLFQLFVRPRAFFSDMERLARKPELLLLTYLIGIAYAMDKVDQHLLKTYIAGKPQQTISYVLDALESWTAYWGLMLVGGLSSALFLWLVMGWFYRKRLEWSEADKPDPARARQVWTYQSAVDALPAVLVTLTHTVVYPSYLDAWEGETVTTWILIGLNLWGCWVSYVGATTAFVLDRGRALFWFLLLPAGVLVLASGVLTALISQMGAR
ncbi:hypothetical protein CDN99_05425 [Roseateles aquatilis]|uniref:Uncharacterized protein n=2 Tax=Roseateles aquatilis TaxID=431061 RepID=A0A246JMJ6_9BURK|nr:hypothetical protein CDN99_05425 [Roseateles aquatilis]